MSRFFARFLILVAWVVCATSATGNPCTIESLRARHPDFCESRWRSRPLTPAQTTELFHEVRSLMRELILQGRSPNQLTDQEASLLSRIETTELGSFTQCGTGATAINASYRGNEHRVTLCDNLRRLPIPALVGMIGHEIGHSADSCQCQTPHLHTGARERLQIPPAQLRRMSNGGDLAQDLQRGTGSLHIVSHALLGQDRLWQDWAREGKVEVRGIAMPLSEYPLNGIRMCLANQAGLMTASTSPQLARSRDDHGCNSMGDYETMADVWGAYALEKYFERHPELQGTAALGMFENRKHELCSPKGYPETERKLAEIWMSRPATARALGCEPASQHRCLDRLPFRGPATAPSPATAINPPCEEAGPRSQDRTGLDVRWLRGFLNTSPGGN